jgi:hypothetical protein
MIAIDQVGAALIGSSITFALGSASVAFTYLARNRDKVRQQLDVLAWRDEYLREISEWAREGLAALATSVHLCDRDPAREPDGTFYNKRHDLRVQLSVLIDRGRWFFPNVQVDYGQHKEGAYRGLRHEILDPLVVAYRGLSRMDYCNKSNNSGLRDELVTAQREFVDRVQYVLDPRRRRDEIDQLLAKPTLVRS